MFGIENISVFVVVSFGLAISPGPDILYVLTRGLAEGRKSALAAAAGFSLGNIFHICLLTLGVSALIAANPALLEIIKYAGAAYLSYIAFGMWNNSKVTIQSAENSTNTSQWRVFWQSLIANILNPKVILFFLALFPQFIPTADPEAWKGILLLGCIFIIITFIVFSLVALFAGKLNQYLYSHQSVANWIPKISALVLVGIAIMICIN